MTKSQAHDHTNTIWMYWHDGWDNAPEVVQLCLKRMRFINKHHRVMALSQDDWTSILPSDSYRYKLKRSVNYFWFHELFNQIYYSEAAVRELWDSTRKIDCDIASRQGPHFFSEPKYLTNSSDSAEALKVIKEQKEKPPVYKLMKSIKSIKSIKDSLVLSYLMGTVLEF